MCGSPSTGRDCDATRCIGRQRTQMSERYVTYYYTRPIGPYVLFFFPFIIANKKENTVILVFLFGQSLPLYCCTNLCVRGARVHEGVL